MIRTRQAFTSLLTGGYRLSIEIQPVEHTASLINEYFEKKGAVVSREVPNGKQYKVRPVLWSFDPLWRSQDNFIGVNPVVMWGSIRWYFSENSIEIFAKRSRVRIFSYFFAAMMIWGYVSTRDALIIPVGAVFVLMIELFGIICRTMFKKELGRIISETN